jgi:hypothetical protein
MIIVQYFHCLWVLAARAAFSSNDLLKGKKTKPLLKGITESEPGTLPPNLARGGRA